MDLKTFKQNAAKVEEWLAKEYQALRTGKATPVILDGIVVDSYGSKMKINQLAGVTVEDARTLRIVPWDKGQMKDIEKAIIQSDLGLSVTADDAGLRVIFPDLTSERRDSLVKVARAKLEDARITLKKEREDMKSAIEKREKEGNINEDEERREKEEMQKIVDQMNKTLEEMAEKKETDIRG
tara:strand:+ start:1223 stop:1768 length:546 start_codon:yes stop_codon:yes gene_type:complete